MSPSTLTFALREPLSPIPLTSPFPPPPPSTPKTPSAPELRRVNPLHSPEPPYEVNVRNVLHPVIDEVPGELLLRSEPPRVKFILEHLLSDRLEVHRELIQLSEHRHARVGQAAPAGHLDDDGAARVGHLCVVGARARRRVWNQGTREVA